jgi:hypothetical protein
MIDKQQAQHMTDVAGGCNRLNEISQLLGYAVTAITHEHRRSIHAAVYGSSARPVRRQRPKVRNSRGVRVHLDAIVKLPLCRLIW